jgi:gluconolactonase
MKKRSFFFLGLLCSFGYYSCQKSMQDSSEAEATMAARKSSPACEPGLFDPTHLVSPSAHGKLDTLATGFKFTEGPAVDRHGNVFFTDQPDDRIYRWDAATGKVSLFLQGTGRANGMAFDKQGNLIACADMYGELWKIRPDGSHEVLVDNYNGHKLNGPNDVWINPVTGGIYITDPMFPRDYWLNTDPRKVNNPGWPPVWSDQGAGIAGHVYYLAPHSKKLVRVTTMAGWSPEDSWPNGVVGTPDGKKIYINKWAGDNKGGTWSFNINRDGTLSNMKKVTDWGGDGMSMDERGNIYISNGEGLMVFDPKGNNILTVPTGGGATNNVFAGKNNKLLIITGGGLTSPPWPNNQDRLTALKMNVKGVERF